MSNETPRPTPETDDLIAHMNRLGYSPDSRLVFKLEELERERGKAREALEELEQFRREIDGDGLVPATVVQLLSDTEAERDALKAQLAEARERIEAIEVALKGVTESFHSVRAERDELRQINNRLRSQVAASVHAEHRVTRDRDQLRAQLSEAQDEARGIRLACDGLENENAMRQERITQLRAQVAELHYCLKGAFGVGAHCMSTAFRDRVRAAIDAARTTDTDAIGSKSVEQSVMGNPITEKGGAR